MTNNKAEPIEEEAPADKPASAEVRNKDFVELLTEKSILANHS